ncbi:hypothetical protein MLD38_007977 [Melastoma candidum]|uniref:Uncharacterized protein n=1 Tax=Melastoma candidum TaxID=119954 RepID=A0ACB9RU37_9MYRT|nr:hypothetical protein MLD38_007977 [Melastoma candidum]
MPLFSGLVVTLLLLIAISVLSPRSFFSRIGLPSAPSRNVEIWRLRRKVEWRPCNWWTQHQFSGFADVFDVDYFVQQMAGFVQVAKDLPAELASKEPFHVDCSKREGQFDYLETVLPQLLEHRYISFTPEMSQRRDRYPEHAKAALCQGCYNALRLIRSLEEKASQLMQAMPKPFMSLHLRFEPDMVAYSQCKYLGLSESSMKAIEAAWGDKKT